MWCKGRFTTSSDSRIKTNIEDINDNSVLQKILAIKLKTYHYVDEVDKSNRKVYGEVNMYYLKQYLSRLR